ncbi:MAG: hypothetical protein C4K49_06035 [Candidatus Thorarchaeota archaeon]|nr:MAG: hypothetical protein C4K49_06035 [Candidatus Thorarchaeota archaeon]
MDKCSVCGKPISPAFAERLRSVSAGGLLMCRACAMKKIRSGDMPSLQCKRCDGPIEPEIMRRIIAARRRGIPAPMLCRNCYLTVRSRSGIPEKRLHGGAPLEVEEWACVKCGASLEPEEVDVIKHGQSIECPYCGSTITLDLFR